MVIKHIHPNLKRGFNRLVTWNKCPEMMHAEFGVMILNAGDIWEQTTTDELVIVLNHGKGTFRWDTKETTCFRDSSFFCEPYVLHAPSHTSISVIALVDNTEITVSSAPNDKHFNPEFYGPGDLLCSSVVDTGKLDGKVKRIKRVFFDRSTSPLSNLFCGELVNYPGCWACFPPHIHSEPEIYYYKFYPSNGYGFSEYGDDAFRVQENDVMCIPNSLRHSQATAPGYAGFIQWTQVLQDTGKNIEYRLDPVHAWLDRPDAVIFPKRGI